MPGEYRGCLGCHESHSKTPTTAGKSLAMLRAREIIPPSWTDTTVSYARYARPVLDKYCSIAMRAMARAAARSISRPGRAFWDGTTPTSR